MEEAIQLLDANTALVNRTETVAKFVAKKAVEISQKEILSLQSQIIRIQSLAIEFADWLMNNTNHQQFAQWRFEDQWLTTNELYEVFLSERENK